MQEKYSIITFMTVLDAIRCQPECSTAESSTTIGWRRILSSLGTNHRRGISGRFLCSDFRAECSIHTTQIFSHINGMQLRNHFWNTLVRRLNKYLWLNHRSWIADHVETFYPTCQLADVDLSRCHPSYNRRVDTYLVAHLICIRPIHDFFTLMMTRTRRLASGYCSGANALISWIGAKFLMSWGKFFLPSRAKSSRISTPYRSQLMY